jgi:hypothetical protein
VGSGAFGTALKVYIIIVHKVVDEDQLERNYTRCTKRFGIRIEAIVAV